MCKELVTGYGHKRNRNTKPTTNDDPNLNPNPNLQANRNTDPNPTDGHILP